MEALRRLENVQAMLSFAQRQGISTADPDADRFLANFLLFMVQPHGVLNIESKVRLIIEHLSKISTAMLEKAFFIAAEGEGTLPFSVGLPIVVSLESQKAEMKQMAVIGFDAMQRAVSTFEDFCRSYFMFHKMDVCKPHSIFQFLPVLFFTESYIYQLDLMNERYLSSEKDKCNQEECCNYRSNKGKEVESCTLAASHCGAPSSDSFLSPLLLLLQHHGLLTERIERELKLGIEYWELERNLCHALMKSEKLFAHAKSTGQRAYMILIQISIEKVMHAIHLKSFDYRVLNLLLYQLRGEEVNELHMEFLSLSELLVEISDDLYDYEDDVIENNFNIMRMFVGIYGPSVAPSMLAKYITEIEENYNVLLEALEPDLSSSYRSRCQEAAAEGGSTSTHAFGTWTIPPVIAHEESYRSEILICQKNAED